MEKKVKVNIYGGQYTIQGEADPQYINQVARYVDTKMNEVSRSMPGGNPVQVAILAALNIADEYFQLKDIENGVESDIVQRTKALISMLEEGLIGENNPGFADSVRSPRTTISL